MVVLVSWKFKNPQIAHQAFFNFQDYHLTLKMASAQVIEMSVTNNSPSQGSNHPADLFQSWYIPLCDFVFVGCKRWGGRGRRKINKVSRAHCSFLKLINWWANKSQIGEVCSSPVCFVNKEGECDAGCCSKLCFCFRMNSSLVIYREFKQWWC